MSTAEVTAPRRSPVFAYLAVVGHGILAVGLLIFVLVHTAAAKKTFDEFGMTLPWLTKNVIRVSDGVAHIWQELTMLLLVAGVGDFLLLRFADRRVSKVWFIAITALLVALCVVAIGAIQMPMMQLRESLAM